MSAEKPEVERLSREEAEKLIQAIADVEKEEAAQVDRSTPPAAAADQAADE